jgi:proteasome accessory factor A
MRKLLDGLYRVSGALAAASIVGITVIVCGQVALNLIDWLAKRSLVEGYRDRHGCSWDDHRLAALDLQYHDLRPARSLISRLPMERLVDDAAIAAAVTEPPRRTRAWFRGRCLAEWPDAVVTANWDSLVFDVGGDPLRRVPMMDPLKGTADHTASLFESCDSPSELLERLSS